MVRFGIVDRLFSRREKETVITAEGTSNGINVSQALLDALSDDLGGDQRAAANRVAAVEFAMGLFSRAFMVADSTPRMPALNPQALSMAAREVMFRGNAVHMIELSATGQVALLPASLYEVEGGVRQRDWRYEMEFAAPSGAVEVENVPAEGVVHLRVGESYLAPWQGVSPLVAAGLTAQQLAIIEQKLQHEARGRVAHVLTVPDGTKESQFAGVIDDIKKADGRLVVAETMARGVGQGQAAAPKRDYETVRIGPMIPETSIDLREKGALAMLGALGIPPALYAGEGAALREAYRQFLTSEVEPMASLFAHELTQKLGTEIRFSFRRLFAADIATRARSYNSLVQGGIEKEEAKRLAGLSA